MAQSLCSQCSALCCRYFALPIDNPTRAKDFDDIRWYLCHENVVIFVEKKQWYMGIMNKCRHLQADNRCGIYETRPKVCRTYTTDNCDYHGGEYDFERLFTSAEELKRYGQQQVKEWRANKRKKSARKQKSASPRLARTAPVSTGRAGVKAHPGKGKRSINLGIGWQAKPEAISKNGKGISLPVLHGV